MKMFILSALALSSVSGLPQFSAAAAVRTNVSVGSHWVSYGDLDLGTHVGADRLIRRVRQTANRACDVQFAARPDSVMARGRACVSAAFEHVIAEVPSIKLRDQYDRAAAAFVFDSAQ